MATASTRKELQEVDDRVKLYFYIQNLRYADRNRELSISVRDTVNTRGSIINRSCCSNPGGGWRPATKDQSSGWVHFSFWKSTIHGVKVPQCHIDNEPNLSLKKRMIEHNKRMEENDQG
jgi:hypothetical protein